MKYMLTFALLGILSAAPAPGQTTQTDSQTLQAILTEMRAIHNDVRLSQTTQILLAELQMQQNATNRATERRDDVRTKLTQVQDNEKNMTAQLTQFQACADATIDATRKQQFTDMQANLKIALTNLKSQEQDRSSELQDAETALRKEQQTLAGIQAQLDDVVKKLQPASSQ